MKYHLLDDGLWRKIDDVYAADDNFLMIDEPRDDSSGERICAVYFSSNGLYFPKTVANFDRAIAGGNRFEWFGTRIRRASRHLFLRDLKMRWYQDGISSRLDTVARVADFLRERTVGFRTVCVGSSAGGYAALLFSALLNAERCFAFSPCIDVARSICLNRGLIGGSEYWDGRYDGLVSSPRKYGDLTELLRGTPDCRRYAYVPVQSVIDGPEYATMRELPGFRFLRVDSAVHGLDLPREDVARLINLDAGARDSLYDGARCWTRLALRWRLAERRSLRTAVRLAADDLGGRRHPYGRKRFYANLISVFTGFHD